jgi:two-component system nitrogen regulation response regulator GlnG
LREHRDDTAELAHHFLYTFNGELGLNLQGFDPEVLACFRDYHWPGNIRELQSVVKETMLRSTGPIILPESLPQSIRAHPKVPGDSRAAAHGLELMEVIEDLLKRGESNLYAKVMRVVERMLLARVLQDAHGHQAQAAERLGLNRSTLRYKLRDLGLSIERTVEPGEKTSPPPVAPA